MKNPFKKSGTDWDTWAGPMKVSGKQKLIDYCIQKGIPIYTDNADESSTGIAGKMRPVVSEAELDKRIREYKDSFWRKVQIAFTIIAGCIAGIAWLATKFHWFDF